MEQFNVGQNMTQGGSVGVIGAVALTLAPLIEAKTGGRVGAAVSVPLVMSALGSLWSGVRFLFKRRRKAAPKA